MFPRAAKARRSPAAVSYGSRHEVCHAELCMFELGDWHASLPPIEIGCCRFRSLYLVAETRVYAVSAGGGAGGGGGGVGQCCGASHDPPPQPLPTRGRGGVCRAAAI